ncbi:hypothetical protein JCM3765_000865 [Sporobolomyces pararoseus]
MQAMDVLDLVHEERTITQRPFGCSFAGCEKGFARKSDLVRHERIHTNERPWNCSWPGCKRDFIQRSALVVHMRTHTGERPHKCEYHGCDKAFSDSSSLARHRRIHTGKRPYMCAVRNCLKTFCRKTTLTKHIKKNHPQYAHTPDAVSLASFGPDTPQLGYTPSIGGDSGPQTPSDNEHSDDEMGNGSYSYFPPQLGQTPLPSYPSASGKRSTHRSQPQMDYLSTTSPFDSYSDSHYSAPSMERSVSHGSQAYPTPPTTHQTRFRSSSRRQAAAAKGRYREYNSDEEEEQDDGDGDEYDPRAGHTHGGGRRDDDDDYVEGAEPDVAGGNKYRRGAVSVGSNRVSRRIQYPGSLDRPSSHHRHQQQQYHHQQQQQQQYAAQYHSEGGGMYENQYQPQHFAPPPSHQPRPPPHHSQSYQGGNYHRQQQQHIQYSPQLHHSFSNFQMSPSYTAPIPQYEFDPHSQSHDSPSMGFAAPPLRRASSFSTLENGAGHFSNSGSSAAGPLQSFAHHHLTEDSHQSSPPPAPGVGLGLTLGGGGSPFTPELHERRLSEMHNNSLSNQSSAPTYSYEMPFNHQDSFAPPLPGPSGGVGGGPLSSAASDPLPNPSSPQSTTPSFAFSRPLSTGNTPRRGSIGFPNLPHHLTNESSTTGGGRASYGTTSTSSGGGYEGAPGGWQSQRAGFSSMTSRLLEKMDQQDAAREQQLQQAQHHHHHHSQLQQPKLEEESFSNHEEPMLSY